MTRAKDISKIATQHSGLNANFSGTLTGGTIEPTTDVSPLDNAALGYRSDQGLVLTGEGQGSDVTLKNKNGNFVAIVPTGTISMRLSGTPDNGSSTSPLKVAGKETIWVPASSMRPTLGADKLTLATTAGLNTSYPEKEGFEQIGTTPNNAKAQFSLSLPKSWNRGSLSFRLFFFLVSSSGTAWSPTWYMRGSSVNNNGFINAPFGSTASASAIYNPLSGRMHTKDSGNLNLGYASSGAASNDGSDLQTFELYSNSVSSAHVGLIMGVQLFFTTSSKNDN